VLVSSRTGELGAIRGVGCRLSIGRIVLCMDLTT
jgi:hypothetical protein